VDAVRLDPWHEPGVPHEEFGRETDRRRTILTGLTRGLGGDPDYVSPTARLAQAKSEALLQSALVSGPLTEAEREANDLENLLLAETNDHADWELLGQLVEQLPAGTGLEDVTGRVRGDRREAGRAGLPGRRCRGAG